MEPILDQSDISNNFYLNSFRIIYKKKIDWMFTVLISYSVKYLFRFHCYLLMLLPSTLIGDLVFAIEQTTVNYLQKWWGIHYIISNTVSNILPSFMIQRLQIWSQTLIHKEKSRHAFNVFSHFKKYSYGFAKKSVSSYMQ